jgi:YfiH family protein
LQRHQLDGANSVAYYTFPSLDTFDELVHGVTTRHGGVSAGPYNSLNLSAGLGDDQAAVQENIRRACAALGLCRTDVVSPNQRHTANVRRVGQADRGQLFPGYDALITDERGVPLLLRYADCTPVLVYDPVHHALAVIHSGWRGTVQGAPRAAVEALAREYGSRPADLVAAVGPSIGPCCYEVGTDVIDATRRAFERPGELLSPSKRDPHDETHRHFDLWAANHRLLAAAGVRHIEVAEICTACHTDDFYSYRASGGRTGHFGAIMALK